MILCLRLEKLADFLATLSPLMNEYQGGNTRFPDLALSWLTAAEKMMSELRLPEGAEMSSLRGRIVKAGADTAERENGGLSRSAVRRARSTAAAGALDRAEEVMRGHVLAARERLDLFESKLCEGLTAFLLQNKLPVRFNPHQQWLLLVWKRLQQCQTTLPLALYLSSSLSLPDRCHLLARVLERMECPSLPESVE